MEDWLKELPGYKEFEEIDREILAKMERLAKIAEQKVQIANLAQKLFDAVNEHRFVYYIAQDGSRILH